MNFTKTHHEQWKIKQSEEKCPEVVIQFISQLQAQCMDKFNLKTFFKKNKFHNRKSGETHMHKYPAIYSLLIYLLVMNSKKNCSIYTSLIQLQHD